MPAATKMRTSLKFTCRIALSQSITAHPLPTTNAIGVKPEPPEN